MSDIVPLIGERSRWFYFWEYNNGRIHIDISRELRIILTQIPGLRDAFKEYFRGFR